MGFAQFSPKTRPVQGLLLSAQWTRYTIGWRLMRGYKRDYTDVGLYYMNNTYQHQMSTGVSTKVN